MHNYRSDAGVAILVVVMILRLVDQLNHPTRHLGHLTFDRRPPVVLELRHLDRVLHLAVSHVELAAGVIRTALAMHVLDENVIILDLVVGPIARALFRCVANLKYKIRKTFIAKQRVRKI